MVPGCISGVTIAIPIGTPRICFQILLRSCLKIGKRKEKAPEKDQLCSAKTKKSLTDASSQK